MLLAEAGYGQAVAQGLAHAVPVIVLLLLSLRKSVKAHLDFVATVKALALRQEKWSRRQARASRRIAEHMARQTQLLDAVTEELARLECNRAKVSA